MAPPSVLSRPLITSIRELADNLVARRVPFWQWTFYLARRLMLVAGLTDADRRQAARVFHRRLAASLPDPREVPMLEVVTADLLRFTLAPPRHAEGRGPLEHALAKAEESPLHFPAGTGPLYDKIASIAFYLDLSEIDPSAPPCFLPQSCLARILGVPQPSVSRMLRLLIAHRVIVETDASYSFTHRRAKCYRFVASEDSFSMARDYEP